MIVLALNVVPSVDWVCDHVIVDKNKRHLALPLSDLLHTRVGCAISFRKQRAGFSSAALRLPGGAATCCKEGKPSRSTESSADHEGLIARLSTLREAPDREPFRRAVEEGLADLPPVMIGPRTVYRAVEEA
jgi:hypothetical protein